jgi:hypothetical protein
MVRDSKDLTSRTAKSRSPSVADNHTEFVGQPVAPGLLKTPCRKNQFDCFARLQRLMLREPLPRAARLFWGPSAGLRYYNPGLIWRFAP